MKTLDTRFNLNRLRATETACDKCGEEILESETRYQMTVVSSEQGRPYTTMIMCECCADLATCSIKS
jgi:uncharacterized protein with PIN domain